MKTSGPNVAIARSKPDNYGTSWRDSIKVSRSSFTVGLDHHSSSEAASDFVGTSFRFQDILSYADVFRHASRLKQRFHIASPPRLFKHVCAASAGTICRFNRVQNLPSRSVCAMEQDAHGECHSRSEGASRRDYSRLSKPDPLVKFTKDDIAFVYGSKWKQRYFTKRATITFRCRAQWDVTHQVWRALSSSAGHGLVDRLLSERQHAAAHRARCATAAIR